MNRVVWKYELVPGENVIRLPSAWKIVHVASRQPGSDGPAVWIEREREAEVDDVLRLMAVGTGHDVPAVAAHIGSAWCGEFMWHVYRLPEPAQGEPER